MSQQDKFERIITSLHEAMLDDDKWQEAAALIDDACGVTGSYLVIVGGRSRHDAKSLFDQACYRGSSREEPGRDYAAHLLSPRPAQFPPGYSP